MTFSFGAPSQPSATASAAPAFSLTTPGLTTTSMGGFGAPAAAAAAPFGAFGTAPPAQPPGLSFGATTSTAPAAAATPFSYSTPAPTAASTGGFGGFGAAPTATPAFGGFGGTATTTAQAPAFGGFGSTATSSAPPAFGGYGTPATVSAAPAFNIGGFGGSTASTAAAPTFNLNAAATATKPLTLGGGFGTTPASSAPFGGLTSSIAPGQTIAGFGAPPAGATQFSSAFNVGGPTQPAAAPGITPSTTSQAMKPSVGLGGTAFAGFGGTTIGTGSIPVTTAGQLQAGIDGNKAAAGGGGGLKETNIPKELMDDIDNFKRFVKEEKSVSSDIAHVSPKAHQKLKTEIKALNTIVKELASGVSKQKIQVEKLKKESALEMQNVEIAQRTKDTPPALQYENVAPYAYFNRLIADFENQMIRYARQIEETEQHLMTTGPGGNGSMTPDDLVKAMQKIHSAFISLAGKYEPIHDSVKQQKAIYLQKYRQKHGTVEDPFEINRKTKNREKQAGNSKPHSRLGPSPFTGKPDPMALARATLNAGQTQGPRPAGLAGPPTLGLGTANNAFGMPATGSAPAANPFGGGGGYGFGAQSNTTGLGATTNPFGAPASTSIFGNTAATSKPNLTLGFGQTSTFGGQTQANALPAFGQSNTFGTPQTQPPLMGGGFGAATGSTGGFGTAPPASNFSFGPSSAATGTATPGLFGSTMSPFGQQQVLGKRGKH